MARQYMPKIFHGPHKNPPAPPPTCLMYVPLVETTKIENVSFSYKTAISEANVKTKSMVSTKWTYHKEWSFASNHFIFLIILFQFKNFL